MSNFEYSYPTIEKNEGTGITNHKNDKGGITNAGLTYPFYAERCQRVFNCEPSLVHFKNLSDEGKKACYFDFWKELNLDQITSRRIAEFVFDFCVNSGRATKIIQQTLVENGVNVVVDNQLGEQTFTALNESSTTHKEEGHLLAELKLSRLEYLWKLGMDDKTQRVFWAGWFRRVFEFR